MRDPRLEQHPACLAAKRRACDARRDAYAVAEAEAIVSGLAKWCREVLFHMDLIEAGSEGHGLSDLLTLPPAQLLSQAFCCISNAARRQSLEDGFTALIEGSKDDQSKVPAWLFGWALAKALVDELAANNESPRHLLSRLWNLVKSQDLVRRAFRDSLRERLHNSPSAPSAILSELETVINDINSNPGIGVFSSEREDYVASVDAWRSTPSIDRLWKDREVRFQYDLLDMVADILPAARADVLIRLDHFDFPHPINQVLEHQFILHDRDEIAAALKDAPRCSDDGRSWNHRLLALLVLRTADGHCDALWRAVRQADNSDDADSNVMKTVKATLIPWFEDLGRIVMARPDGQFLGPQWLFMKVADERMDRARNRIAGDRSRGHVPQNDLIEWIAIGLSKAGLTAGTIDALIDFPDVSAVDKPAPVGLASHDGENTKPRLGALFMMSLVDHLIDDAVRKCGSAPPRASAEDGQRLLDLLDGLLASRDSAFEVEARLDPATNDLPASCFGYLLANAEEPAERWRQSWDRLTEQRRRVQYWSHTNDGDALAPTLFLLAVGTSGIAWLLSPPHSGVDKARKLWRELFDRARECWLTITLSHLVEHIETHIRRLFTWHPTVFGESVVGGDVSEPNMTRATDGYGLLLAQDLDLLGGDDLTLATCCVNAYRNGATAATMDYVLKYNSGHIGAVLRQFEEWQKLERNVRRSPHVVEVLAELRAKIRQLGRV